MTSLLKLVLSLKTTYSVNTIIYSIKQLPLIKRILPDKLYASRGLKTFAKVLAVLKEISGMFIGKILYAAIVCLLPMSLFYEDDASAEFILHAFIFMTVAGLMNTIMFDPRRDAHYALTQLRVDAKKYTLIQFFYTLIKNMVGWLVVGLLCCFFGMPILHALLMPLYYAAYKIITADINLHIFTKQMREDRKPSQVLNSIVLMIGLAAAYAPPAIGMVTTGTPYVLPFSIAAIVMGVTIIASVPCLISILRGAWDYRGIYRLKIKEVLEGMAKISDAPRAQSKKYISDDTSATSNKKGFHFLNELFVKRHKKLLWNSAKKVMIASAALFAIAVAVLLIFPEAAEKINGGIMGMLPIVMLLMYIINRGQRYTQTLFVNCDQSLLTYAFYKQPKHILTLFRIRLIEISKVNLAPAMIIGAGLDLVLWASGGTENPMDYVILPVTVFAMAVFFSVHYLILYYLLQPYNVATEIKSATYKGITFVTYLVALYAKDIPVSPLVFAIATIAFSLVYSIVACILVYMLAPRTFKLRT